MRDAEGFEDGPFAGSRIGPDVMERVIGSLVSRHRGRGNAVKLQTLMMMSGKNERVVRGIVEQLVVTHRMRIGATERGYYMIETAEDLSAALARPIAQIKAMARRLRVLMEPREWRELLGQLTLEDE